MASDQRTAAPAHHRSPKKFAVLHPGGIQQAADGVEVDVRVHKGELVLAHDPITRDGDDLVRLGELYDPGLEAMIVYLDFKQDAVVRAAEQIHRLGAFHRFVFFAEQREIVRSLATAKGRYPALVADASLLHVAVEELERWFGASLTFSFALPTRP